MPVVVVDTFTFTFPNGWTAEKYDSWRFYVNNLQNVFGGAKAVDLVAFAASKQCCWLIEAKDYRLGCTTNAVDLAKVVAHKVRDTLAGLTITRLHASIAKEKTVAQSSLGCGDMKVVLLMETLPSSSPLFPHPINPANVQLELRRLLRKTLLSFRVVDIAGSLHLPWTVT